MAKKPIGVFDSGVGGLTVVAAIRKRLPAEDIIYLGDLLHLPYGSKSSRAVLDFTRAAVGYLLRKNIKLLVMACNTATSIAGDIIAGEIDIPVVGVIKPGARAACRVSGTGRIGVMGTERTVRSGAYADAIHEIDSQAVVIQKATPLLVPLIEEGWIAHPVMNLVLEEYARDFTEGEVDTVVLGCTHYPLILRQVEACVRDVNVVDSAETTAEVVERALAASGDLSRGSGKFGLFLTDLTDVFRSLGEHILEQELDDLTVLTLGYSKGRMVYS